MRYAGGYWRGQGDCQTAGDMRAERAECGSMGLRRSCGGEGDMRADGARRDMGDTDIKKTPYREI